MGWASATGYFRGLIELLGHPHLLLTSKPNSIDLITRDERCCDAMIVVYHACVYIINEGSMGMQSESHNTPNPGGNKRCLSL